MPPKRKAKAKASVQTTDSSIADFTKLKVAELRDECTRLGIDSTGTKPILVKRLQENADEEVPPKQVKQEEQDEVDAKPSMKDKLKALAEAEKSHRKQRALQVDSQCTISGKIVDDYDCMLNQTNIGANNNKYYVIQMVTNGKKYYVWTRWGRVGEPGQSALKGPTDLDNATKEFEKKFKDKTKNNWNERDNFQSKPGKYTMLEMDTADDDETDAMEEKLANLDSVDAAPSKSPSKTKPCSLDNTTESLMKLIFSQDMFNDALIKLNLDVKKMPLGKLSKIQIAKGFEVLDDIETELDANRSSKLSALTSLFYTLIPHNFGRQRPPVINNHEVLRLKMDMLLVLGDIEIAQTLKKEQTVKIKEEELPEHPFDVNYKMLSTDLVPLEKSSEEYQAIERYTTATKPSHVKSPLLNVWKVCRHGEEQQFAAHDSIKNRKLLWHGTNVAVVVAILKGGLRIMPHSGGRVGRGIYFASEHGKSYYYVSPSSCGTGIMFLNEVALGNEHTITRDDSSLKSPPKGFDSVIARGTTEPDPSKDKAMDFDGKTVHIPQGSPKKQPQYNGSHFSQSEYLVYKENQCRIRYLLTMKY